MLQEFAAARILAVDLLESRAQRLAGIINLMAVAAAGVIAEVNQAAPRRVTLERENGLRVDVLAKSLEPFGFGDELLEQTGDVTAGGFAAQRDRLSLIGRPQL